MGLGVKTGGRTRGTPNKRTQDVLEKLEELGCDPIEGMARLAQQAEADGDKNLAAQMYKELAPYIAPKRKAIEQTIKHEEELSMEEMEANYRETIMSLSREDKILIFSTIEPEERIELIEQMEEQES